LANSLTRPRIYPAQQDNLRLWWSVSAAVMAAENPADPVPITARS